MYAEFRKYLAWENKSFFFRTDPKKFITAKINSYPYKILTELEYKDREWKPHPTLISITENNKSYTVLFIINEKDEIDILQTKTLDEKIIQEIARQGIRTGTYDL